jgi:hypothetical protein
MLKDKEENKKRNSLFQQKNIIAKPEVETISGKPLEAVERTTTHYYPTTSPTAPVKYNFYPVEKTSTLPPKSSFWDLIDVHHSASRTTLVLQQAATTPTPLAEKEFIYVTQSPLVLSSTTTFSPQFDDSTASSSMPSTALNRESLISHTNMSLTTIALSTASTPPTTSIDTTLLPNPTTYSTFSPSTNTTTTTSLPIQPANLDTVDALVSEVYNKEYHSSAVSETEFATSPTTEVLKTEVSSVANSPLFMEELTTVSSAIDILSTTTPRMDRPVSDYKSGFLWFTKSPTKMKNETRFQNKSSSSVKNTLIKTVSSVAGTATLVNNNYVNPLRTTIRTTATSMRPGQTQTDSSEAYSDIRPNLNNKYEYKWPASTRPPLGLLPELNAGLPNNLLLGNYIYNIIYPLLSVVQEKHYH